MLEEEKYKKLRQLLIYLSQHNKYYQKLQKDLQYDPYNDDIYEIYHKLPIMTKMDIINNQDTYFSDNEKHEEILEEMTSGSSGNVLKCYKTSTERSKLALNIWKQRRLIDPGVDITNYMDLFNLDLEKTIGKFYNMNEDVVINNFYKMMATNPRWLAGPISLISKFAILINEGAIKYENDGSLKYIEFHGENVDKNTREFIEKVFKCSTLNNYGTRETWCVALDCKEKHLHTQDYIIADSIFENGYEKLLLTSVNNRYMPIIKYKTGDCGTVIKTPCQCGNTNQRINLIGGREADIITGSNILGNFFFDQVVWAVYEAFGSAIHEYQVVQKDMKLFEFILVKGKDYCEAVKTMIIQKMKAQLGEACKVEFTFVDHVKPLKNGKAKKFYPFKKL